MEKNIIILTKSEKNRGYCVAGIDIETKKFIRLVSEDIISKYALKKDDITYNDDNEVQILDIVNVVLKGKQGIWYQPENYTIDDKYRFEKNGQASINDILEYLNEDEFIFYDTENSILDSKLEEQDRIYTLTLIEPQIFKVRMHNNEYGKRRLKASVLQNNKWYNNLIITDLEFIDKYYNQVENSYDQSINLNNVLITVSLGEINPRDSKHYKLIASVIERNIGLWGKIF